MDCDVQDRHEPRRMGNVRLWPKADLEISYFLLVKTSALEKSVH